MLAHTPIQTFQYRVCPVFGSDIKTEGTCSGTAVVALTLTPVDNQLDSPALAPVQNKVDLSLTDIP